MIAILTIAMVCMVFVIACMAMAIKNQRKQIGMLTLLTDIMENQIQRLENEALEIRTNLIKEEGESDTETQDPESSDS